MEQSYHKNGIIKRELLLLEPFLKEPTKKFTLFDIKKISKNKSQHYVYDALKKFAVKKILYEEKIGNNNAYYLNCNSSHGIFYLVLLEGILKEKREDIPFERVYNCLHKINNPFVILLIIGSYALGSQKKNSDIDVIVIIPNSEDKKKYEIILKDGDLIYPQIHGFVFKSNEFYEMLVNKEFNLGKEAVKKHVILSGAEDYYKILFEAIKHGFTN